PKATTRSDLPHSLSYHANTLTLLSSITIVESASIIADSLVVAKSIETSGSSVYLIISASLFSDSCLNALLTSSTVTSSFKSTTKSTRETLSVGTRSTIPCNLPFKNDITSPRTYAAPVDVRIID